MNSLIYKVQIEMNNIYLKRHPSHDLVTLIQANVYDDFCILNYFISHIKVKIIFQLLSMFCRGILDAFEFHLWFFILILIVLSPFLFVSNFVYGKVDYHKI